MTFSWNRLNKGLKKILKDGGTITLEFPHLMRMLRDCQFDTIYHEHLRYYSLSSLRYLFDKFGLEIIQAKKIPTHGGSIRVYASFRNQYKKSNSLINLYKEESRFFKKEIFSFSNKVINSKLNL